MAAGVPRCFLEWMSICVCDLMKTGRKIIDFQETTIGHDKNPDLFRCTGANENFV